MLAVLFAPPISHAQNFGQVEETNTNVKAYFYFVEPGEGTIEVKVMGSVRNPGLYRLGEDTGLDQLMALTGGPVLGVRQEGRDRRTTVRLFRVREEGSQEMVFERAFAEGIASEEAVYPPLRDGDIMTVEVVEDRRFDWRDALTIVSAAGSVAFAIAQFVNN